VGSNPLTDGAKKDLTLIMFEMTSVFTTACDMWQVKLVANQMLIEFCQHFTNENKECLLKLTASQLSIMVLIMPWPWDSLNST